MFPEINFRPELVAIDRLRWFKFCRPKILVVTDGLNFDPNDDFGLTQFISTIELATIYGTTPTVVKAHTGSDSNADITNFHFDDPNNGLSKSRYDVVFLFGVDREFSALPQSEVDAIAAFMEAGGGVFATGDHEDLGAGMSKDVPRVRNMRYWLSSETPDIGDTSRLSTNLPGDNDIYEFADQSDTHPQRLYVNYRTEAGGIGDPHPLLQSGSLGPIEVFPDHPHEGECRIPTNLNTTFTLGGDEKEEWPDAISGGAKIVPEMAALTMSHGDAFPGKEALTPRSFMAIVAYDGHLANRGRISCDATWHHFVNINIDGTDSGRSGLQDSMGNDTPDMLKIREYYKNLASWLMPKHRRICLYTPWIIAEILRYPLFEEVRIPKLEDASADQLNRLGDLVIKSLANRFPVWQARQMLDDALESAIGVKEVRTLNTIAQDFGRLGGKELSNAAVGGMVSAVIETALVNKDKQEIDVDALFVPAATKAARLAAEKYYHHSMDDLQRIQNLYKDVLRSLQNPKAARKQKNVAA